MGGIVNYFERGPGMRYWFLDQDTPTHTNPLAHHGRVVPGHIMQHHYCDQSITGPSLAGGTPTIPYHLIPSLQVRSWNYDLWFCGLGKVDSTVAKSSGRAPLLPIGLMEALPEPPAGTDSEVFVYDSDKSNSGLIEQANFIPPPEDDPMPFFVCGAYAVAALLEHTSSCARFRSISFLAARSIYHFLIDMQKRVNQGTKGAWAVELLQTISALVKRSEPRVPDRWKRMWQQLHERDVLMLLPPNV